MNTYTGMAVDAFRAQEAARRRLVKAEAKAAEWARRVPREEFGLYVAHTELIRMEYDLRQAREHRDHDGEEAAQAAVVQCRAAVAALEGRAVDEAARLAVEEATPQ